MYVSLIDSFFLEWGKNIIYCTIQWLMRKRNLLLVANGYNYKCHLLGNTKCLHSHCNLPNLLFLALEGELLCYVFKIWIRSFKVVQDSAFETRCSIISLYSPRYRDEQDKEKAFTLQSLCMTVRNWECMCQCAGCYKTKWYCYVKKHAADLAEDKTSKGSIKEFMFRSSSLDQILSFKACILIQTQVFQRSSFLLKILIV